MPNIKIDLIRQSPYQPRLTFDLEDIRGSIEKDGILVALTVRKKDGYYELIDGERRLRIAKEIGYKTVPCDVIDIDDETALRMIWKVNTLRKDYIPKEKAYHFRRLQKEFGFSLRAIATQCDVESPATILDYLHILMLPKEPRNYEQLVWDGVLRMGHIHELAEYFNEEGVRHRTELVNWLEQTIIQGYTAEKLHEVRKPYLKKIKDEQIKAAREAAEKAVPVPKPKKLETAEEFEEAAKALKRKAKELMTPEQKAREKRKKQIASAKISINATVKKIDKAREILDVSRFSKRLGKINNTLESDPVGAKDQLTALGKEVIAAKKAKKFLDATAKRIDGAEEIIDVKGFRKHLNKIEKTLEENPAEAKDQLVALGKEVTEVKRRRQAELREESKRKREEEAKEKAKKREEALRKRLEKKTEKKIKEAEKKAEKKAERKLRESREFIEQATKMARLTKLRGKYPPGMKRAGSTLAVNALNELTGGEWLKFTRSWYEFDALESDLEEERAATIDVENHPATFSSTMISEYVRFFTKKGGVVLDPFVGIGSTLVACMRAGRRGIGIDIVKKFADISRKRVEKDPMQRVICGDAWEIGKYDLPKIDYCITSPPYYRMLGKMDVTQKKRMWAGLATDYGKKVVMPDSVGKYVGRLVGLFSEIADKMRKGGYLTVILQNFRDKEKMVPLAWKFAMAMQDSGKWIFKGERVWCQAHKSLHPFGYPADWVSNIHHHYCLIFKRRI